MYTASGEPMYTLPQDDAQLEMTLEDMEEEYTALMRRHQDLLDAGKVSAAADLMDYITKLEELIADMETNE